MSRQLISSGAPWEATVGYSRAVRVGNVVEVAGTTAMREGEVVGEGDAAAQATCILTIIEEALRTAGASLRDVVRTRLFLTDIARDWEAVGAAHGAVFADIRPAATMVQVGALIDPRLLIEIEATAIIPEVTSS
ncbi:MAG: RidA family protein [Hymenobacteraceae bacterium]|nr:RidA family protein [Hymenobacteraceae bacterium]